MFRAYRGFLAAVADAELARLFALVDPVGARIHRNIRDTIKHSCIFVLVKDFRGCVIQPSNADTLNHLPPFPIEILERRLHHQLTRDRTTPAVLKILHDVLVEQSEYRRSITIMDAVQVFRPFMQEQTTRDDEETIEPDRLLESEIESIRQKVELALKEKIILTYLARGKVNRLQAEAMANALHDLTGDWCSGNGDETPLHAYLRRYLPLTSDEYERDFRAKMEYLLRIAREEFAARLMREI